MPAAPIKFWIKTHDREVQVSGFDVGVPGLAVNLGLGGVYWSITHLRTGRFVAFGFKDEAEARDAVEAATLTVPGIDWAGDILWTASILPEGVADWRDAAYGSRT